VGCDLLGGEAERGQVWYQGRGTQVGAVVGEVGRVAVVKVVVAAIVMIAAAATVVVVVVQ